MVEVFAMNEVNLARIGFASEVCRDEDVAKAIPVDIACRADRRARFVGYVCA